MTGIYTSGTYSVDQNPNIRLSFLDAALNPVGSLDYSADASQVLRMLGEPDSISYFPDDKGRSEAMYVRYYFTYDVTVKVEFVYNAITGTMTSMEMKLS